MTKVNAWIIKAVVALANDFTTLKGIWAWIYLTLYVVLAVYGALKVHEAFSTIVTVTGGLTGGILTAYVLAKDATK